ncbi:MAG: thioester reductase domain-containing protein [bacterium]
MEIHFLEIHSYESHKEKHEYQGTGKMVNEKMRIIQVENYLAAIIASKTGSTPEGISREESFFSLGIDSIILQEIMGELGKKYDHLPPTLLFEYPNIQELAEHLAGQSVEDASEFNEDEPLFQDSQRGVSMQPKEPSQSQPLRPGAPLQAQETLQAEKNNVLQNSQEGVPVEKEPPLVPPPDSLKKGESVTPVSQVEEISLFPSDTFSPGDSNTFSPGDSRDASSFPQGDLKNTVSPVSARGNQTKEPLSSSHQPSIQMGGVTRQQGYEIAVIGMSGRFPKSPTIDAFWQNLIEGRDCIEEIPKSRWEHDRYFDPDPAKPNRSYGKWGGFIEDIDKFDPLFFAISPQEAEQMDPQQRLLLECVWETMEHAGYGNRSQYKDKVVGLFAGAMWNEYSLIANQGGFLKDLYCGPGSLYWAIANRISYIMDFKGPSILLDTACSSSLTAVHLACQSILSGDCDMAIAGGVNLSFHPSKYVYLSQAGFLSKDGRCRSFGINGTGYVPGEGVGAVLLKPLDKALKDKDHIYGIVRGSSMNHGGKAAGFTVPNPEAQARLIIKAFERANISPEQIGYIECHGTGTSLGDPIEIKGLTRAFKKYTNKRQFCAIGSVKSNVGHLEAAAGVAALIKVLLSMEYNKIPKSIHSEIKNPNINFEETPFYVVNEQKKWISTPSRPRLAGISSFGAGGSNTHLIVESFEGKKAGTSRSTYSVYAGPQRQDPQIIVLSARKEDRLKAYAAKLVEFLEKGDPALYASGQAGSWQSPTLSEIAYTLQVGREAKEERIALVVSSMEELREKLTHYGQGAKDIKGFYKGNIRANKQGVESLVDGEEGREFLKVIVKNKKLDKLAQLWVSGVFIDWSLLYSDQIPCRTALPTYPFARDRYWIPDSDPITITATTITPPPSSITPAGNGIGSKQCLAAKLHPLIGQNISTLKEQKFSTLLTGDEFFLEDHVVNNQKMLPGVAVLEMARAAAEIAGERKVQKLKDIVWTRPVTVGKTPQLVYACLHTQGHTGSHGGMVAYEVITDEEDNQRISHAQGKIIYESQENTRESQGNTHQDVVNIEEVKKRCTDIKDSTACYRLFRTKGFAYGPRFQAIQKLWSTGTEALSFLVLPLDSSHGADGFHDFELHPSLMDGALQTVIGLLGANDADSIYLPFALGEVELIRPLVSPCYAYGAMIGDRNAVNTASSRVKSFNILIVDEAGHVLVRIKDFSLRALSMHLKEGVPFTGQETSGHRNTQILSYRPVWEKLESGIRSLDREQSGHILIFDTNEEVYDAFRNKLAVREDGRVQVTLVKPGAGFKDLGNDALGDHVYKINPGQKGDYVQLLEVLKGKNLMPGSIIYLWSQENFSSNAEILSFLLERGIYSLFFLTQALMEQKSKGKIRILCAYTASSDQPQPQYAAFSGFARTVCRENPRFSYKIIEIQTLSLAQSAPFSPRSASRPEAAFTTALTVSRKVDLLLREVQAGVEDEGTLEIRYDESGQRWVKVLREFDLEEESAAGKMTYTFGGLEAGSTITLKNRGVYVITGGAGGLGFIFAEYLARAVKARLLLSGRSDLTFKKEAKIKELKASGSEVVYIKADIARLEDARMLIAEAKARFGKINGIIHCAGVVRDSLLVRKTKEEMDAVLAPKVFGTVYLDEASGSENLDFFVLFSSITAVMGNQGQCDYAYGNSFMDAFAAMREGLRNKGIRSGKALSINWPLWKEGGMRVDEQTEEFLAKTTGMRALSTKAGLSAFVKGLTLSDSQFVVTEGDRQKLARTLGVAESPALHASMVREVSTIQSPGGISGEPAQERKKEAGLLPGIQKDVIQIVSDILRVDRDEVHLDEDMSDYGFDSISYTVFANRINEKFNLEITPAIFFEHPTIGSFTAYLCHEYQDSFLRHHHLDGAAHDSTAGIVESDLRDTAESSLKDTAQEWSADERFFEEASIEESSFGQAPYEEWRFGKDPERGEGVRQFLSSQEKAGQVENGQAKATEPEAIAIIGMSGVMPQSEDLEAFWKNLEEGKDLITEIPRDRWEWEKYYGDPNSEVNKTRVKWGGFMKEVDKFDALFFGISPREAELMDPQQRIFLETVWKTIEDAGYKPSDFSGTKTGVFVGAATTDYHELLAGSPNSGGAQASPYSYRIEAHTSTGRFHSITANRISYLLNLHGPSEPVDTACSSSLVALHRAVQSLRSKDCDAAIVGGVNVILTPTLYISFSKAGMLSEDGRCKTFDKKANGYVRGEGAGALLLKPLSKAEADGDHIYAVIRAVSENHGGHANSLTAPNPNAQAELISSAYEEAKIDPSTVSYIEAHGTGTTLGDPIEINGLKKAFGDLYKKWNKPTPRVPHCALGTVKTNIGHLETAAGIAGVLKVLLAMKYKKLPATVHFQELNPYIQLQGSPFSIVKETRPWDCLRDENGQPVPRRAGVSSFGFGGANAHVVLEEYTKVLPREDRIESQTPHIIVLSAKDKERLKVYAAKMAEFIRNAVAGEAAAGAPGVNDPGAGVPNDSGAGNAGGSPAAIGTAGISLADVAYTLQTGREEMEERLAVVASDMAELADKLTRYCRERTDQEGTDIENLFVGNVQQGKAKRDLFIDDDDQEELLHILIKNKRLAKLAQLWVSGVKIDWKSFYQTSTQEAQALPSCPRRISLPTYPFARERYWIPEGLKGQVPQGHGRGDNGHDHDDERQGLHPLIDKIVPSLSLHQGVVFQKTLLDTDVIVRDHNVKGQAVLPGAGYLEMARAAVSQVMDNQKIRPGLSQIVWLRPLAVQEGKKEVRIVVTGRDGNVQYEFQSIDNGAVIVHAKGMASFALQTSSSRTEGDGDQWVSIEEIKARCTRQIAKEAIYSRFQQTGMNYGPYFQGLSRIWLNDDEALGHLIIPGGYENELKKYALHPALIDATLQTVSGFYEKTPLTLLPFAIDKVEILHPLKTQGYAYVKAFGNHRFSMAILNETGLVCVKLHDVVMRELKTVPGSKTVQEPETVQVPEAVQGLKEVRGQDDDARGQRPETGSHRPEPEDRKGGLRVGGGEGSDFFYCPRWVESPLPSAQKGEGIKNGKSGNNNGKGGREVILIVHPPQSFGLGKALSEAHRYDEVIEIELGTETGQRSGNQWQIDAKDPFALDRCIAQLADLHLTDLHCIYFLGGIQGPKTDDDKGDDLDALERAQERGVISLFRLIKALGGHNLIQPILQLKVITNDVHQISSEQVVNPYAASLFGFTRVMVREYLAMEASCIDISLRGIGDVPGKGDVEGIKPLVKAILTEPGSRKGEEVAIREGKRYVRTLVPITLPAVIDAGKAAFRHQGVYVILGGAGGIGLELCRYLAENYQAHLVLLGRGDLDDKRKEKISRIESKGGRVLYVRADASDYSSMTAAIEKARSRFGKINGVIHSAIVLKDMILENMDEASFRMALTPKVRGSMTLYKAVQGEALDFMMFFSSAVSFFGNMGQSNYTAGCTFKDAFARYLNQREGYPVKTINWGFWGSVGVAAASEEYKRRLTALGAQSIEPDEGMEAVRQVLGNPVEQIVAIKAQDFLLERIGVDLHHHMVIDGSSGEITLEERKQGKQVQAPLTPATFPSESGRPRGGRGAEPSQAPQDTAGGQKDAKRRYIEEKIVENIRTCLGMSAQKIDFAKPFAEYGVDSILGLELIGKLNMVFGIALKTAVIFNHANVNDLSRYIYDKYGEKITDDTLPKANAGEEPAANVGEERVIRTPEQAPVSKPPAMTTANSIFQPAAEAKDIRQAGGDRQTCRDQQAIQTGGDRQATQAGGGKQVRDDRQAGGDRQQFKGGKQAGEDGYEKQDKQGEETDIGLGRLKYQTKPVVCKNNPFTFHNIFLTGPTGILGGYLIKELLETTTAQIYCLIRAQGITHGLERLRKILISYGAQDRVLDALNHRVVPIIGDVSKANFGLLEMEYLHLANAIDCTIHIAASTNLIMPYDYLAPINVQGVKNIINFALKTKQKYLIHVSSYHVMADVIYRSNFAFTEQHFDVGQKFAKMGYQETKFEGERLVREASQKGLLWNIVRPGNIFGEAKSGLYPLEMSGSASIFHRLFELIIKSGIAAFGNNYFDITPVDYIAKAILFLGLKRNSFRETYHLLNTDKKHWYEIINLLNAYGYKINLVLVDDYLRMVHQDSLPLDEEVAPEWLNLMKYGFANKEFFINDGYADATYTQSLLKEEGIICPKIDVKLLGTYLEYYASKGIIPLPPRPDGQEESSLTASSRPDGQKEEPSGQQLRSAPGKAHGNDREEGNGLRGKSAANNTPPDRGPELKEKTMKSNAYEFIIVGSGAGGATMARELVKKGKRVLVVEQGRREKNIGGLMNSLRHFDHHKITLWPKASKEGVFLYRAVMAGGSTVVSCGNGTRCSEEQFAAFGINLDAEFTEAEKEMNIAPFNMKWLSKGSRKILEASISLGYKMEPMPKFMRYNNCRRCGTCYMGCQYNAKWTALDYLDEAIKGGADVMYETAVERVLHKNGKAIGICAKGPKGQIVIPADAVVLCAGGLATPVILQKSGIEEAGSNLFGDLLVNTYGVAKNLSQTGEPSMALLDNEFHASKGFILSTWPQPSRVYRFAEAGIPGMLLPPDRTLGIMTKSADDPTGQVFPDGTFSKAVTEKDRARLQEGIEISKEILIRAGVDSKSIVVGNPAGAHPGGTAAIGKIVNRDLQTEITDLYVCDASVFPASLGAPPILAIAALAKRLAKALASKQSAAAYQSAA